MKFVARWLVTAVAVGAAVWLVPGIMVVGADSSWIRIGLFALVLALINGSIKPVLQFLGAPVSFLTLGLFYLVINTLMLYLAAWVANGIFGAGFYISSFGAAFVASIVISIVSAIVNFFVSDK